MIGQHDPRRERSMFIQYFHHAATDIDGMPPDDNRIARTQPPQHVFMVRFIGKSMALALSIGFVGMRRDATIETRCHDIDYFHFHGTTAKINQLLSKTLDFHRPSSK